MSEEIINDEGVSLNSDTSSDTKAYSKIYTTECDDAARYILGGDWRIPTKAEGIELKSYCSYAISELNGVSGALLTSKVNGNSIFVPFAGFRYDDHDAYVGQTGYLWTSDIWSDDNTRATGLAFVSGGIGYDKGRRKFGFYIRPVSMTQGVDLGLPSGLRWASSNLTATGLAENPESYGNMFAWGEVQPKELYSATNYRFGNSSGDTNFAKYNSTDGLTTLQLAYKSEEPVQDIRVPECDDAARYILGGDWRIPTHYEFQELVDNCNYTKITIDGLSYLRFESKINEQSITFGFSWGTSFRYWCSDRITAEKNIMAYRAREASSIVSLGATGEKRYCFPIRPVSMTQGVDLGLPSGLRWADSDLTNNGLAESYTELRHQFKWGEISESKGDSWDNYKWGTSDNITKYNSTDGLTTLQLAYKSEEPNVDRVYVGNELVYARDVTWETDDIARQMLGGKWRIPTKAELENFVSKTTATKSGDTVVYTYGDVSITLGKGIYWSSTRASLSGIFCYGLQTIKSNGTMTNVVQGNERYRGNRIRPVVSLSEATDEDKANGVIIDNLVWRNEDLVGENGFAFVRWADETFYETSDEIANVTDATKPYKWYDYTNSVYTKYITSDNLSEIQLEYHVLNE